MNSPFVIVPPPTVPPKNFIDPKAKALGLCDGLRVEHDDEDYHQWRCHACGHMQIGVMVWVPDSVMKGDPQWSVTAACLRNYYNGHHSGWCIPCAKTFKKEQPPWQKNKLQPPEQNAALQKSCGVMQRILNRTIETCRKWRQRLSVPS